jgi:phage terminase large subunit-like protein
VVCTVCLYYVYSQRGGKAQNETIDYSPFAKKEARVAYITGTRINKDHNYNYYAEASFLPLDLASTSPLYGFGAKVQ